MENKEIKQPIQNASADDVGVKPTLVGPLTGAALRYDGWRNISWGHNSFGFNWNRIHAGSHVFVSASEVDNAGNRFLGLPTYTVHNIVVKEGRVEFYILVGWYEGVYRVSTDILTIDP
jgi:hypothetical protein